MLDRALDVFCIPSTSYNETSMSLYIIHLLEAQNISYTIDNYGNILVDKGSGIRPCFCAHLDTVHMYHNGFNVSVEKAKTNNRVYLYAKDDADARVGIGGDDKCGIVVCLELLAVVDNIKVVFFSQEESGGTGSGNVDKEFFSDCAFLGGIDRWNGKDFVDDYCGDTTISKAFRKAITPVLDKFGFSSNSGMFTDAFNVMSRVKIGISCFNISCGYYCHHSAQEYVDTNELYNSFLACLELSKLRTRYEYQLPVTSTYSGWGRAGSTYVGKWNSKYYDDHKWDYETNMWVRKDDWKQSGWVRNTDGSWSRNITKTEDKTKTTTPVRKCAMCGIELLAGEYVYCWNCKWKKDRDARSYDDKEYLYD